MIENKKYIIGNMLRCVLCIEFSFDLSLLIALFKSAATSMMSRFHHLLESGERDVSPENYLDPY
jgi:hypothetical protein